MKIVMAERCKMKMQPQAENKASSLVALPAEIKAMIVSYLRLPKDLAHLCQTCKALNQVAQPALYTDLVLKVPLCYSDDQSALEKLVGSSSKGLQSTLSITVAVQYDVRKRPKAIDAFDSDEGNGRTCLVYKDDQSQSSALNVTLRLLFMKLPRNRLLSFYWNHISPIGERTLKCLYNYQGAGLHDLRLNGNYKIDSYIVPEFDGLTKLHVGDMDTDDPPCSILAENWKTLRCLHLGYEFLVAIDYAREGNVAGFRYTSNRSTREFIRDIEIEMPDPPVSSAISSLEELKLCGLDLNAFALSPVVIGCRFSNLSMLTLESCFGLSEALNWLVASGVLAPDSPTRPQLKSFFLRHELADDAFMALLETFLASFKGLEHLHVLLEGQTNPPGWGSVFDAHGATLKTLVWDHRKTPRVLHTTDVDMNGKGFAFLTDVCCKCPKLIGLGITLDWTIFTPHSISFHCRKIASSMSRLTDLETFNIRNMPEVQTLPDRLSVEQMHKGFAMSFLETFSKCPLSKLKILALGARSFEDVKVGPYRLQFDKDRDFLRLRLYALDYVQRLYGGASVCLTQLSKGVVPDECFEYGDLTVFKMYWLSYFPTAR